MSEREAALMAGPLGAVARELAAAALAEFDHWAKLHRLDKDMGVYNIRTELDDYLGPHLAVTLTAMQLAGQITISEETT